jgi:hypothetical protein
MPIIFKVNRRKKNALYVRWEGIKEVFGCNGWRITYCGNDTCNMECVFVEMNELFSKLKY